MLAAIQNDLFDLGAELATPDDGKPKDYRAAAHRTPRRWSGSSATSTA